MLGQKRNKEGYYYVKGILFDGLSDVFYWM